MMFRPLKVTVKSTKWEMKFYIMKESFEEIEIKNS